MRFRPQPLLLLLIAAAASAGSSREDDGWGDCSGDGCLRYLKQTPLTDGARWCAVPLFCYTLAALVLVPVCAPLHAWRDAGRKAGDAGMRTVARRTVSHVSTRHAPHSAPRNCAHYVRTHILYTHMLHTHATHTHTHTHTRKYTHIHD